MGKFYFFDSEGIGFQVTLGGYSAQKFAGLGARIGFAEQRRKQALQPVRACARAEPEIEVGSVQMIGMELKLPVVAGGIVEGRCVIDGTGPSRAKSGGAGDGGIAMTVFPFKAGIFKFQWKIEAGGLQLRSCEGEGAAPAAVRHAVIPFAGDASRGATGDFPATIHSSAKSRGNLEEIAGVLQFSIDAQGAFSGDEIIAEAKLELIGGGSSGFWRCFFGLRQGFFLSGFERELNGEQLKEIVVGGTQYRADAEWFCIAGQAKFAGGAGNLHIFPGQRETAEGETRLK